MSWSMVSKLFNGKRSAHWQVFSNVDGEWSTTRFSTRPPNDVLDLEPATMVQDIEIDGEVRTGIFLPESGKFYALHI